MFKNTYLIDDDVDTLYLHRYFLNEYNFFENLLEFQDASKAMKSLLVDDTGDKNLILLDLNMPIISGWEFVEMVCAELKPKQLETTYIVIVSSSCNPRDISRANAHPYISSYIEKPFLPPDIELLLERLRNIQQVKSVA